MIQACTVRHELGNFKAGGVFRGCVPLKSSSGFWRWKLLFGKEMHIYLLSLTIQYTVPAKRFVAWVHKIDNN